MLQRNCWSGWNGKNKDFAYHLYVLQSYLVPDSDNLFSRKQIFQRNNATIYTFRVFEAILDADFIDIINWPAKMSELTIT